MAPTRTAWADGFARQAQSDWAVYRRLSETRGVALCHRLHYMQMACEKIAKAYRLRETAADVDDLLARHVGFAKFAQAYFLSPAMKEAFRGRDAARRAKATECVLLAAEVEKLAPAVDREQSPANSEYPWPDDDAVVVPCDYAFPTLALLSRPGGRAFLNLVDQVIEAFR